MFARLGRVIGYFSDTPTRTCIAVVISGMAFATVELLIHLVMRRIALPSTNLVFLDASVVGMAGGLAGWVLLRGNRERRQRVRLELERISELNHEVRNALQVISHSHFDAKPEHREMVFQSIDRIDAVLKRLFPVLGGPGGPRGTGPPRQGNGMGQGRS
jgi:hypothetical protein